MKKNVREITFVKNLIILAFGTILPKFGTIITLPIITGGLSTEEYGIYDLLVTLLALLLPIATLQIQTAAFRFLIDHKNDNQTDCIITNACVFAGITSIITIVFFYFFMEKLSGILRIVVCIYFFLDIFFRIFQQIARGLSFNKKYSISVVIEAIVNLCLLLLGHFLQKISLEWVIGASMISSSCGALLLLLSIRIYKHIRLRFISWTTIKEMLGYSWPMIPNAISAWILKASDRLVISAFLGVGATAVYAAATKIPTILTTIQYAYTQAWQENASISQKDDDADSYFSKMFDTTFCFSAGVFGILIAGTPILFQMLIKGNYDSAYPQIPILFMGSFWTCLSAFMGGVYVAHKKTKSVGVTTTIAAVLNLLIDLLLINQIGIYAASISTVASYMFLVIYRMFDVRKFQKMEFHIKKIVLVLCYITVMCVVSAQRTIYFDCINAVLGISIALILNYKLIKRMWNLMLTKIRG